MLAFRKNLMDIIIQSPDSFSIEVLIRDSMNRRFKDTTRELKLFLQLLESDLVFQLNQSHNPDKLRNLLEAHRVIKEINVEARHS